MPMIFKTKPAGSLQALPGKKPDHDGPFTLGPKLHQQGVFLQQKVAFSRVGFPTILEKQDLP